MGERVALVTGGSAGVGLATARMLIERGYVVVIAGRDRSRLDAAVAGLGEVGTGLAVGEQADLAELGAGRALVRRVVDGLGRIDVLVNNAGWASLAPIGRADQETLERAYVVNAITPAEAIDAAWNVMREAGGGVVVNVSTMGTKDPFPGFFAYAAAKSAVNTMARSVANEGKAHGIRGFAVAPGAIETAMLRGLFSMDVIPASAALSPEDVARVIVECVEGARDDQNGETIYLSKV